MAAPRKVEDPGAALLASLQSLGFSQYEAQCYIGLLRGTPQTGYGVAKATGVPQPKVYEALRRLVARAAAYEIVGEPVRFLAVPVEDVLDRLEAVVASDLSAARGAAAQLTSGPATAPVEVLAHLGNREGLLLAAQEVLGASTHRVYLSASPAELAAIEQPIRAAADRGVEIVVLSFGQLPFEDPRLRTYRHASTDGVVFRRHQARHLAVIVDSAVAVWGLAADGSTWSAIRTDSELVLAALKGFIRHDIDMQQVFADFGPALLERYGPGLEGLEDYRRPRADVPARPSAGTTRKAAVRSGRRAG